jgi:hypothetical protein
MSIRRMMLFTLGGFFKSIISLFKTRVLSSSGNFEAETNLENQLNVIGSELFNSASLVITPNAYKENVLFSATPSPVGNNLLLQSEGFTSSPWILLATPNITRTANAGISPIGINNATLLTSNTDLGDRGIRQVFLGTTNTQYVFSLWARSDNGAQISLDIGDVNRTTFTLTNTWQRLQVVTTPTSYFVDIQFAANQLGKTCLIWGAQLEIGTTAGTYIPTTTRQAINETICDLTVTRATTATRVNEQGLIAPVPYNLFSYSEDFINSNWGKKNTTIINNSIAAPNGMMTADKIIGNNGVAYYYTGPEGVNVLSTSFWSNSTEKVVSFYLKYGGLNRIRVMYGGSSTMSGNIYVEVDLQLGIITGTYGGSFASNFFIEDAGNGWYRVGFTVIMTIQSTNNRFGIGLGDTIKTVGDGVDGVYVWGAQLVDGSNKPYQPTTNRLNVPRIDYTTGQPAILVEPQRTNLFLQSEDFTNGWAQEGISIVGNTQISPDGALTADSIFELATNDVHRTYRSSVTVTANAIYTASFFVKKSNIRYIRLILTQQGSTTIWAGAQFDLDTKTFTSQVGSGGGVFSSASITSFVNGWYRISVSGSIPGTSMFPVLALSNGVTMLNTDTRGCPIYLGNVNNELYVWGGQLELGTSITSYMPTTTATVTRNADIISNTNVSALIGQTEGTILIKGAQFDRGVVLRIRNNTNISVNRLIIFGIDTGGNVEVAVMKNNVTVSTMHYLNVKKKNIIMVYSQNIFKAFISGKLMYQYNYTIPTDFTAVLNTVEFGSLSEKGTATFDLIALWQTKLTDQQAIQLTTL